MPGKPTYAGKPSLAAARLLRLANGLRLTEISRADGFSPAKHFKHSAISGTMFVLKERPYMKTMVFALVSLVATAAMAFPAVKDKAVFTGIYAGAAGGQIDFTQTLELTKFDTATGKFTLSNTFALQNGQVQSQEAEVDGAQLMTNARVAEILAQCATVGGTLADTVVPAGTFKTCAVPTQRGGTTWIGDAPFGFVKEIYFDEELNRVEVELTSFSHGQ